MRELGRDEKVWEESARGQIGLPRKGRRTWVRIYTYKMFLV